MIKRIISMLLTLCMVLALLPVSVLAATAEDTEFVYSFRVEDIDGAKNNTQWTEASMYPTYDKTGDTYTFVEAPLTASSWGKGFNAGYICHNLTGNNTVAVYKIKLPRAGRFDVTFKYYDLNGGIYDMYICPVGSETYASAVDEATGIRRKILGKEIQPVLTGIDHTTKTSTIKSAKGTYTAESEGEYYIAFSSTTASYLRAVELKLTGSNDQELEEAFGDVDASGSVEVGEKATINILTYSTDGAELFDGEVAATETVSFGQKTSITAPAAPNGYTFLYWAKGATDSKQIIPGETCTIYPTVETTYMIAVYALTDAAAENKVEFYNYNGQLLTDAEIVGDKMPALPSMTGYGKADHWVHYGTDKTYEAEADASAFATGTHIFVAQYDDLQENITVTAENCTVNSKSSATVKYGDTVTCVATGDGDKTFKWWTKTVNGNEEVVSLEKEYSFKAWETCTVTAVYGESKPSYFGKMMRIILDELTVEGTNDKAYMAEFVGLDSAIEKGIMLGTKKIAMSSKDNQFTIINDEGVEAANIKGYAILANGTLITDK